MNQAGSSLLGMRRPDAGRSPGPGIGAGIPAFVLATAVLLAPLLAPALHETGHLERTAWLGSSLAAAGFIALTKWRCGLTWLAPPIVYAVIYWLFHFGLVFPASVAPALLDAYPPWAVDWLYYPESGTAAVLAAQFLGAFLVGWMLLWRRAARHQPQAPLLGFDAPELISLGWWVVAAGGFLVAKGVARHGVSAFTRGYEDYFPIHNDFSWALFVIAFGLALHLAGGRSLAATARTALWAYAPLAVVSFLAGARTAPLATGAVLAIVLGYRGYRWSRVRFVALLLAALAAIAFVQQTRGYGIGGAGNWPTVAEAANPLSGMMELGGSLRPVSAAVSYVDVEQQSLYLGSTYAYPAVRIAERLLGSGDAGEDEPRSIASYFSSRYRSAMGFSVAAEAYANGGTFGVIAFALAWGAVLGVAMSSARGAYGLASLVVVVMPMIVNIRNSFIFVPGWVLLGTAALAVGRWVFRPALLRRTGSDPARHA